MKELLLRSPHFFRDLAFLLTFKVMGYFRNSISKFNSIVTRFGPSVSSSWQEEPNPDKTPTAPQLPVDLTLSYYLREPLASTRAHLKSNQRFLAKVEKFRNHFCSTSKLKNHIQGFTLHAEAQFQELAVNDPRSRIIASFHFGDFLYGLNKLIAAQPKTIRSHVLSQYRYSPLFMDNMQRGFGHNAPTPSTQLMIGQVTVSQLAALLRQKNRTLLMFADLPRAYGETVCVNFLGRQAQFPKGIALLALASRVPLLPAICYQSGDSHYVELGKQIEPTLMAGESMEAATVRITQQLISFFEYFLLQHPHQWRYLKLLPQYFITPT